MQPMLCPFILPSFPSCPPPLGTLLLASSCTKRSLEPNLWHLHVRALSGSLNSSKHCSDQEVRYVKGRGEGGNNWRGNSAHLSETGKSCVVVTGYAIGLSKKWLLLTGALTLLWSGASDFLWSCTASSGQPSWRDVMKARLGGLEMFSVTITSWM